MLVFKGQEKFLHITVRDLGYFEYLSCLIPLKLISFHQALIIITSIITSSRIKTFLSSLPKHTTEFELLLHLIVDVAARINICK